MAWWWLAVALAGSEVQVEVARAHLMLGQAEEARTEAAALLTDAEVEGAAVDLYLQASASMGLTSRAMAELGERDASPHPWGDDPDRLFTLVEAMDTGPALSLSESLAERFPEHPELQAGLWADHATKKVIRARKPYLALPAGASQAYTMRLHRLHLAVGHANPEVEAAVRAIGPFVPPLLDDVGLHERARAVFSGEDLTGRNHDQRVAVATRAHAMFLDAGRPADAVAMWEALADADEWFDARVAAHGALGAAAAGDPHEVSLHRIGEPSRHDRALQDAERMRHELGLLYDAAARTAAVQADADRRRGWSDLVTGTVLTGVTPQGAIDEALHDSTRGQLVPTLDEAMSRIAKAEDSEALVRGEGDVRWAMMAGLSSAGRVLRQRDLYIRSLADLWLAAAERAHALADDSLTLQYGLAADALGAEHNDLPRWIGEAARRAGHDEAAFAWLARARARGAADLDDVLVAAYDGPADALAVATALAGEPGSRRIEVEAATTPQAVASPSVRGSAPGVKVGQQAPPWAVKTERGELSSTSTEGRMVLLSFWNADCDTCLDQLPAFGSMVRRLRRTGRDVIMVAVSTDDDPTAFQDVYRLGQRWGELVRAPELAETFGLRRVPSTWVIDRSGTVTYFVDHRVSAEELELVLLQNYL